MRRNPKRRASRILLIVVFMILASILFWAIDSSVLSIVIMDILILIFLKVGYERFITRVYQRSNLKESRSVLIQPEGILVETESTTTTIEWEKVTSVDVSAKLILLTIKHPEAVVVPNRVFDSEGAAKDFISQAQQYKAMA